MKAKLCIVAVDGADGPGVALICKTCSITNFIAFAGNGDVPLMLFYAAGERHKEASHASERG